MLPGNLLGIQMLRHLLTESETLGMEDSYLILNRLSRFSRFTCTIMFESHKSKYFAMLTLGLGVFLMWVLTGIPFPN